jgi:hypothetical protein
MGMDSQTQNINEQNEHSSVRLAEVMVSSTPTVPPPPEGYLLAQAELELQRAKDSLLVRAEKARAQGDVVITVQENPELIESIAKEIGIDSLRITVQMAVINGALIQAVFVDGRVRPDRAARIALNRLNWSGPTFGKISLELVLGMHE